MGERWRGEAAGCLQSGPYWPFSHGSHTESKPHQAWPWWVLLLYWSISRSSFQPLSSRFSLSHFQRRFFALCKLATTELTLQKEKNVVSWHTLLWLYFSKYQFLCLTASSRTMRGPSCRPEKLASLRGYCKSPKVAGKWGWGPRSSNKLGQEAPLFSCLLHHLLVLFPMWSSSICTTVSRSHSEQHPFPLLHRSKNDCKARSCRNEPLLASTYGI